MNILNLSLPRENDHPRYAVFLTLTVGEAMERPKSSADNLFFRFAL